MDYDLLFGFLYENIKNNRLKYEFEISNFANNFEIKSNEIKKTKIMSKSAIVKIGIGNNINLLLEDLPINFFLSFGIVVGDKAKIKSFKFKNDEKLYVAEKKVMNKLIERIELDSIKDFAPKKLKSIRYHLNYDLPLINLNMREFSKKIKRIDLDIIHIINSDSISNFVPTLNKNHLKIALRLGLEMISLIENNNIVDSSINIFDDNAQINLLNPFIVFEIENSIYVNKNNGERVYKDFLKEFYFYPDSYNLIERLNTAKYINCENELLVKEISSIKKIKISLNAGKESIPLWTVKNKDGFILIKNKKEFLDYSGINYSKENFSKFKDLYLQSEDGLKGKFCMNYLNPILERAFEIEVNDAGNQIYDKKLKELNEIKNTQIIEYKTVNELILKLLLIKKKTITIVKYEFVSKEKIKEIDSTIRKLLHKIILKSVEFNKLPLENIVRDIFGKYYVSVSSELYKVLSDYRDFSSKSKLISEVLFYSRNLLRVIKTKELKFDYLYDVNNCCLALIEVLEEFDFDKAIFYKNLFNDYFEKQKPKNYLTKNEQIEFFINDVTFVNVMSKKYRVFILLKKDFDTSVFNDNVIIFNEKPPISDRIVKPNLVVLKNAFPYSFEELNSQIKTIPFNVIKYSSLNLKGKIITLKDDYYNIFETYLEYKVLFSNEYFSLLGKMDKS